MHGSSICGFASPGMPAGNMVHFKGKTFKNKKSAPKSGFLPLHGQTASFPSILGLKIALKSHFWVTWKFPAPLRFIPKCIPMHFGTNLEEARNLCATRNWLLELFLALRSLVDGTVCPCKGRNSILVLFCFVRPLLEVGP